MLVQSILTPSLSLRSQGWNTRCLLFSSDFWDCLLFSQISSLCLEKASDTNYFCKTFTQNRF